MRSTQIFLFFLLSSLAPLSAVFGQSGKPVIIRDTDIAEGIDEKAEPVPKERNPNEARKNIDVGDFYYKRKNYVGAILRYLTAIEYQPDSDKAYKSLVKAHTSIVKTFESEDLTQEVFDKLEEEHGQISVAINAFRDFLRVYPDSSENYDDYRNMADKLKEMSIKKDIDTGNYYFERKNYVGAILRYLKAIKLKPDSARAYESLLKANESIVRAYESIDPTEEALDRAKKQYGEISDAINAYANFLMDNPDSIHSGDFKNMIEKFEEVFSRFDSL